MNRKTRAIEERYRKDFSNKQKSKFVYEHHERIRECTLKDVLEIIDRYESGYWFGASFSELERWEKERDVIINVARKNASNLYVRNPNILPREYDPEWTIVLKKCATKEWKLRQTKLYKALQ